MMHGLQGISSWCLEVESYAYTVAGSSTIENPANEGDTISFTITRDKFQALPLSTFKHFLAQLRHQT